MPSIAVVIPTRNRGAQAAEAALAVLRDQVDLELVVVDQSTDDKSVVALEAIGDPRLKVVRSSLRGASNARNAGVAATTAPIIAFTDDDCRPEPTWATTLLRLFNDDPQTGLIFGRVRLPPHETSEDFAASFEPQRRVQQGVVPLPDEDLGIGASFAIRRATLAALGGFDPYLGPGAPVFFAAEETDLIVRALHGGHKIINTTECEVVHLGIRKGPEVRRLIVGYRLSVGAAFAKHARLSGWSGLRDGARWTSFFLRQTLREVVARTRPHPGSVVYFLAGAAMSFRYGVDKEARVFRIR
jgi:glycosyltransferase involved in cell wall biosynthesis